MSTATLDYFHSTALRQRFLDAVDQALHAGRLPASAHTWLQRLTRPAVADDADPLRVDRLTLDNGLPQTSELAAALLVSHGHTDQEIYLYTLADGIEVFSDRHTLLAVLRVRFFQGDANALFEAEVVEGDPFRAQMLAIVDQQVEHLGELSAQLALTPTLSQAATLALDRQLRDTLPDRTIDPLTHLLQIVPHPDRQAAEPVALTQTLAQAVFDDYGKVAIAQGMQRRFLDEQGRPASVADSHLFAQALVAAAAAVKERYADLLQGFWGGTWRAQCTRRELAMQALNNSVRQALYRCHHDGVLGAATLKALLALLQTAPGTLPTGSAVRCHRLALRVADSASCALAGTFVLGAGADRSVLLFSADHDFVRFADLASLARYVNTAQGRARLRPTLALQDQAILQREGLLRVEVQRIDAPLFAERVDSILALQARNLEYVTGLPGASDQVAAMIDDALDVRELLDPRQLLLSAGRWRQDAPFDFAQVWLKPQPRVPALVPPSATASVSADEQTALTPSWRQRTQAFDLRAERLQRLDNALLDCAEQTLQAYLCVLGNGQLQAKRLRVQWLESAPADSSDVETRAVPVSESQRLISVDLPSLLLEWVSGHRPRALPAGAQILADAADTAGHLQVELLQHMLERGTVSFTERYVQGFMASRSTLRRQGDQQLQPASEAASLRLQAMGLDLALARRQGRLDGAATERVRQVLNRPLRALRMASQDALTEVYAVSLEYADQRLAPLCDTLVLRQPLRPDSAVLLWSGESGWRQFSSLQRLQHILRRKLAGPDRERWLQLMGERDRILLRAHLLDVSGSPLQLRLDRVDGHAVQTLQQRLLERQQEDLRLLCQRAMRCRFEAGLFTRLAAAIEVDLPLNMLLDGLAVRVDNSLFEALLPGWLTSASVADLRLYYDLLTRYYRVSDGGKDFLFDIPSVQDHARERLVARLSQDFAAQHWDPDQITVTSRRYIGAFPPVGQVPVAVAAATVAHSESLTDYAINRFVEDQGAVFSVDSATQPQAARLLSPDYLQRLVRRLDIGSSYRALLHKALNPDDARFVTRKRLFLEQLAPMLLTLALPLKLSGQLSAQAFACISRVFEMPDGIAREAVDGVRVIISPLQLVADAGMSPDPVSGVYLICPAAPDSGPLVLLALHHSSFTFREYSNQAALLAAIRNDEALQALLLQRLDANVHRRYAHGGFSEPHLPFSVQGSNNVPFRRPGPIALQLAETKGNVLQVLFRDTVRLLLDLGVSNAVTNHQVDQAGRRFLATLAVEQVLSLLPGKLAALVTLWQSQTLFRASAVSASGRHWGKALSEFSAALGVMVTAREQAIEEQAPQDRVGGASGHAMAEDRPPLTFSWRNSALNAEQRMRLQALEARSVALEQMRHDELLNLYLDKDDGTPYVVVEGKVYQVRHRPDDGDWIIVGADGTPGPRLVIDGNQRWQLDLNLRLKGGGGVVTKINASGAQHSAEEALVIEARGMPEIRRLYRDRARRIAQAHLQARLYLENSLDNLNVNRRGVLLDPRVSHIIGEFFGVTSPGQALLIQIESAIKTLFDAVMEPSLSPLSSPRFIVGSNRPGRENVAAFIIKVDPLRRVFLTEQFFQVSRYGFSPQAAAQGFESSVHHRAAILLHELSHQALDTHDIAYLETMAPFPDLLLADNAKHLQLKAHIERLQNYRLSHRTHKASLFKLNEDGKWRDIGPRDERVYSTILRETQTDNLDDARDVFLCDAAKRSRVMLSNADSLTLLILRLGRHSLVAPSP